jgi:DNA-binding transcriptional ArsR family regulator
MSKDGPEGDPGEDPIDWERVARAGLNPVRLRVLELFVAKPGVPRSAKMVARELGISPRQDSYHAKALHDARLLRIASRHRRRGTEEIRYRANL